LESESYELSFASEKSLTFGLETLRVRMRRTPVPGVSEDAKDHWKPWKRKKLNVNRCEKMLIPLPIPHPVHIAISIYNRDSDQPIPLDSEMCWDILRSIEECYGDSEALNSVSRFRSFAIDSSNDSLDSSSSSGGGDMKDVDSRESVDGTETLPCTNRSLGTNQITITPNNAEDIVESINSVVASANRVISHSASSNSITPTNTSYHWTLSNLESTSEFNRRRNNNSNSNNEVRVDLASPEDISMDEQRIVLSSGSAYGTTV
jgi:hypothetical protein